MKILGFAAPYMLGAVVGVGIISSSLSNYSTIKNEENQQTYLQNKQKYMENLMKSLKHVSSIESSSDGDVTSAKLTEHYYSNAFDVNESLFIKQVGATQGEKLTTISTSTDKYQKNTISATTAANALKQDYSGETSISFSEKSMRNDQIMNSYENMKKLSHEIYKSIIDTKVFTLPCVAPTTEKDVWNRDFTYNRISDNKATLSFNLPWDTSTSKILDLNLPQLPSNVEIENIYGNTAKSILYAITTEGDLWFTGRRVINAPNNDYDSYNYFWSKDTLTNVTKVTIDSTRIYAVADGKLYAKGSSVYLGDGTTADRAYWTEISMPFTLKHFHERLLAIDTDDNLWVMGYGYWGNLGTGTEDSIKVWTKVQTNVKKILYANSHYTFIEKNDGQVMGTGYNSYGLLNQGNTTKSLSYVDLGINTNNLKNIYFSDYTVFYIDNNDDLYGLGSNDKGKVGDSVIGNITSFKKVTNLKVKRVFDTVRATYIVTTDNKFYYTGKLDELNSYNTGTISYGFTEIPGVLDVIKMIDTSYSSHNVFALTSAGDVYAIGSNTYYQLGLGHDTAVETYTKLTAVPNVKDMYEFNLTVILIQDDNDIYFAGHNGSGLTGSGSTSTLQTWTNTINLDVKNILKIGNSYNTNILTNDNHVWGAGYNIYGVLGDVNPQGSVRTFSKTLEPSDITGGC